MIINLVRYEISDVLPLSTLRNIILCSREYNRYAKNDKYKINKLKIKRYLFLKQTNVQLKTSTQKQ